MASFSASTLSKPQTRRSLTLQVISEPESIEAATCLTARQVHHRQTASLTAHAHFVESIKDEHPRKHTIKKIDCNIGASAQKFKNLTGPLML